MSSTDELLKTAEQNLNDAKMQYEHAQRVANKSANATLLDVMKANYENARRNLENVKNLAQLVREPKTTIPDKEQEKPTVLPKKPVDPNTVKLPGSATMVSFPAMDNDLTSFVNKNKKSKVARQADQWQTEAIKESSKHEKEAVKKEPAKHHDGNKQVTLTREQYRKQLKRQK